MRSPNFASTISARGREYADKHRYFSAHWRAHLERSKEAILQGAAQVEKGSVVVLGAGDGKDIPVTELLKQFKQVRLLDIDTQSMDRLVQSLPGPQRARVEVISFDLTAGAIQALTGKAGSIIEGAGTARQAYRQLGELYQNLPIEDVPETLTRGIQSDYVVSSVVASQLLPFPVKWIEEAFQEKFNQKLSQVHSELYATAKLALCRRLLAQHARLLSSLTPGGLIYWSCDVRQELVMGKLSAPDTQQLGERMTQYLASLDWSALLPDLAVAPDAGGEFTAWLTSIIGKQVLPAALELQVIEKMVTFAQSIDAGANNDLIGGELSQYFDACLEPVGEKQSWLWHLDPRHFYRGGVHRVEAWLLRAK